MLPTEFCEKQTDSYIKSTTLDFRKEKGQIFTPTKVAQFMAKLIGEIHLEKIKILDPGAGTGILSCAVIEFLVSQKSVKEIKVDAYETDDRLISYLRNTFEFCSNWLKQKNISFSYNINEEDFILSTAKMLNKQEEYKIYDIIISNPPYFKIARDDPKAIAAREFVYGQPNIYSLFMGMGAKLLRDSGILVFITPRSYTAGFYFRAFRKKFFQNVKPEIVHIFESRKEAFKKDSVLQENIILKARKNHEVQEVKISTSIGINDLENSQIHKVPIDQILIKRNNDIIFRLPQKITDNLILNIVDRWTGSLYKYNLKISTGPVIPFRVTEFIENDFKKDDSNFVPLLWIHNVYAMEVRWPYNGNGKKEKGQLIEYNKETFKRGLVIENKNYVILRRFSSKEQNRRLTAAPLLKNQLSKYKTIGIENHLNYIHRPGGSLLELEAVGLAALLNSCLLDRYFRISNGNTQVSATEIQEIPLPPLEIIKRIGEEISKLSYKPTLHELDLIVMKTIGIDDEVIKIIKEGENGQD